MTFRGLTRALVGAAGIVAAVALAAHAAADPQVSGGQTYTVAMTSIEGSTDDHLGNWKIEVGELSGGDPVVVQAFNTASRAAAQDHVKELKDVAGPGSEWNLEIRGDVTVRSIAVAQVITGTSYYGAVPTVTPTAVVIDSRTARPIRMANLFTDEQAGLNRLSDQTKLIMGKTYGFDGGMPDQEGNAPAAENFANWIPTADGMEIHFAPYQFGVRLAETITVPWTELSDVLAPEMAGLTR